MILSHHAFNVPAVHPQPLCFAGSVGNRIASDEQVASPEGSINVTTIFGGGFFPNACQQASRLQGLGSAGPVGEQISLPCVQSVREFRILVRHSRLKSANSHWDGAPAGRDSCVTVRRLGS